MAGCTTVEYTLPKRHLFRDTDQVPDINILTQLDEYNICNRPVYVHCLSNTGVMCYQGLDVVAKLSRKDLNIQGVVWDSCCGPYPQVTIVRVLVFTAVLFLCSLRDWTDGDVSLKKCFLSTYEMITDTFIPAIVRQWKGKPNPLSLIEGKSNIQLDRFLYMFFQEFGLEILDEIISRPELQHRNCFSTLTLTSTCPVTTWRILC